MSAMTNPPETHAVTIAGKQFDLHVDARAMESVGRIRDGFTPLFAALRNVDTVACANVIVAGARITDHRAANALTDKIFQDGAPRVAAQLVPYIERLMNGGFTFAERPFAGDEASKSEETDHGKVKPYDPLQD